MCCCHVGSQVVNFRIPNSTVHFMRQIVRCAFFSNVTNGGCNLSIQQHILSMYVLYLVMSFQGRLAMFSWMGIPLRKLCVRVMVHVSS